MVPHARHVALAGDSNEQIDLRYTVARQDYERGALSSALDLEQQVVDARRRALGDRDPKTVDAMRSLGITLWSLGRLVDALELERAVFARAWTISPRPRTMI